MQASPNPAFTADFRDLGPRTKLQGRGVKASRRRAWGELKDRVDHVAAEEVLNLPRKHLETRKGREGDKFCKFRPYVSTYRPNT